MTMDDEEHFRLSKELADKVHAQDPEVILQSCVFEWITRRMETVEIPAYVFEAFGLKPEQRCFRLEDALFTDESSGFTSRRDDPAKDGAFRISPARRQDCGFITCTRYMTADMRPCIWDRCISIPQNDRGMARPQSCSV